MKEKKERKNINGIISKNLAVFVAICVMIGFVSLNFREILNEKINMKEDHSKSDIGEIEENVFTYEILNKLNELEKENNYLISPYSIETALLMVKEGATENTYQEIDKVLGDISRSKQFQVKNRIFMANALFMKDDFAQTINKSYIDLIKESYDGDLIYDQFTTPDKINNWVDNKTDGMIPKLMDSISQNFVLGIANALAIDVDWKYPFQCESTSSKEFTFYNGKKKQVEMMNATYQEDVYTISSKKAEGVVIPYQEYDQETGEAVLESDSKDTDRKKTQLEFVGILPKEDIKSYIRSFGIEEYKELFSNIQKSKANKTEINVSLPRFSYDYTFDSFKKSLMNMGIQDAFSPQEARFDNISKGISIYINETIHKTHINLNEKGTKAAAVTFMGFDFNSALEEKKDIDMISISFNRPFLYFIREKDSKDILFMGVVYEPTEWTSNSKSCDKGE